MDDSWAEQRRQNAKARADALKNKQAAESRVAGEYLGQFVRAAQATGVEPEPLLMRNGDGSRTAKTSLSGWYLKADKSVAVDVDGNYYVLTAPLTLKDRFMGLEPEPVPPPLILGKGGRDGEQIDLVISLTNRVPTWRNY